jgi:molybdate transport system substrate-binding protein
MSGRLHCCTGMGLAALLAAFAAWGALDAGAGKGRGLTVFAAASLREAFGQLGEAFERTHPGVHVRFNFAGSQELRTQLENGAPADVFASADLKQFDGAKAIGLVGARRSSPPTSR